jgi:hypothetical protein
MNPPKSIPSLTEILQRVFKINQLYPFLTAILYVHLLFFVLMIIYLLNSEPYQKEHIEDLR